MPYLYLILRFSRCQEPLDAMGSAVFRSHPNPQLPTLSLISVIISPRVSWDLIAIYFCVKARQNTVFAAHTLLPRYLRSYLVGRYFTGFCGSALDAHNNLQPGPGLHCRTGPAGSIGAKYVSTGIISWKQVLTQLKSRSIKEQFPPSLPLTPLPLPLPFSWTICPNLFPS